MVNAWVGPNKPLDIPHSSIENVAQANFGPKPHGGVHAPLAALRHHLAGRYEERWHSESVIQ